MARNLNIGLVLGIGFILFLHILFLFFGVGSYILVHDNLDSEFIYLHVLKMSGNLFSSSESVPNIFNGISRNYFHSEFSFIRVLFYFLPSFWAYVLNSLIIRLIGFFGIYFLAKDYFPTTTKNGGLLTILIATSFATLPLYSLYGLSVMGQAFLFWAFLNLWNKKHLLLSGIIILLFPFYTHFGMIGPFALTAIFLYGAYQQFWLKKKGHVLFWIGIAGLFLSFILANISMIKGFVFPLEASHRSVWNKSFPDLKNTFSTIWTTLTQGQYHSSAINSIPILGLYVFMFWKKMPKAKEISSLFFIVLGIAIFQGIYPYIAVSLQDSLHLLTSFQFKRFTFLLPFLFTLMLLMMNQSKVLRNWLLILVIGIYSAFSLANNAEFSYNIAQIVIPNHSKTKKLATFDSFFSMALFKEIGDHINQSKKDYRVVSIGIHPSIAQYNGFYTLDSYQNNYPLSYKSDFRKIIVKELEKNKTLQDKFDRWGNRCYVYSAELEESCQSDCRKKDKNEIQDLALDIGQLKTMGAKYIFSAVPILNASQLNIELDKTFEDDISKYKIHLYRL